MTDTATDTKPTQPAGFAKLFQDATAWEKANSRKIAAAIGGLAVKSSYGKAVVAVALALLGLQGCAAAQPTVNHAKLDCFAQALQPVAGDVYDTAELVKDMVAGKASLSALLSNLQVDEATTKVLMARLKACETPTAPVLPAGTGS